MNFNKVVLSGTLTRDPELRYTPKGTAIAKISIAINSKRKTNDGFKDEVTFVEIDSFGKLAENAGQYLKKGQGALFEGRLKLDQWEDKQTQQKRQKLGVIAEHIEYGPKSGAGGGATQAGGQGQQRQQTQQRQQRPNNPSPDNGYQSDGPPEDEVPF